MSRFSGEGFSKDALTPDEIAAQRHRNHYDDGMGRLKERALWIVIAGLAAGKIEALKWLTMLF